MRDAKDYAIEHAGYMADAARELIASVNRLGDARGALESAEDEDEEYLRTRAVEEAEQDTAESLRVMQNRIGEFEKRRDRAVAAGVDLPDGGKPNV